MIKETSKQIALKIIYFFQQFKGTQINDNSTEIKHILRIWRITFIKIINIINLTKENINGATLTSKMKFFKEISLNPMQIHQQINQRNVKFP